MSEIRNVDISYSEHTLTQRCLPYKKKRVFEEEQKTQRHRNLSKPATANNAMTSCVNRASGVQRKGRHEARDTVAHAKTKEWSLPPLLRR